MDGKIGLYFYIYIYILKHRQHTHTHSQRLTDRQTETDRETETERDRQTEIPSSDYISECVRERYGVGCKNPCGQCADGASCTMFGRCPNSQCVPGFKPPYCRGSTQFSSLFSYVLYYATALNDLVFRHRT